MPLPAWKTSGSPAKISLTCSGRLKTTSAPALGQDPDREDVAVALVQGRDELVPEPQQPDALQDAGQPWAGRQVGGRDRRPSSAGTGRILREAPFGQCAFDIR